MTTLQTQPTAAVVYPDRARVSRTGLLTLEKGQQRVEVADLPLRLHPDSVRASVQGEVPSRLLGVQVQRVFSEQAPQEQVRELERQIEEVQDQIAAVDADLSRLKDQQQSIQALANQSEIFATALAAGELSLDGQMEIFDGLRKRIADMEEESLQQKAARRDLVRRLEKLKRELEQHRGGAQRSTYSAFVELDVLEPGRIEVELSYLVSGAGWQPLYDLRLRDEVLEAGYLGEVTQRTGEDWENLKLTLSTARPALAGRLPELDPWFIAPRPERLPKEVTPHVPAPAPRAAMSVTAAKEELVAYEAEAPQAQVGASGAAVTYEVPVPVSVPADGAPHKVTVANLKLKPEMDYVTAPRLTEAAYRRANITNDSPYTFLPGMANLFSGDEFIGSIALEMASPGEEIELFLGPDDRLPVARELTKRDVDRRLIGGNRQVRYGYEIRLKNLLPRSADVEVLDQMPVSRHEQIKVRLDSTEPQPSEQDRLNRLTWKLHLEPGEERKVRFEFLVEHPREMDVIGLLD